MPFQDSHRDEVFDLTMAVDMEVSVGPAAE